MSNKHGPGILNLSNGKQLDVRDPDPSVIEIESIASALSKLCRFSGQCNEFYSVAQHSVWVSYNVSEENAFAALMHDATEAFCADVPRPIKMLCPQYENIEELVWNAVCDRFGINPILPEEVHRADFKACLVEANNLFDHEHWKHWHPELTEEVLEQDQVIYPVYLLDAKNMFMNRFDELC